MDLPDMAADKPSFLLIHGAWHGAATWRHLIPLLEAHGHIVRAYDLPGAGANAKAPAASLRQPHDAAALATEPSPNAGVTQADRTQAAIGWIEDMHRQTGLPVVLVGHSMGGLTVTAVAESRPELVSAAVYLSAYMLPPGELPGAVRRHPTMSGSLIGALAIGDPQKTGAARIDPHNPDPAYRDLVKRAFYGQIDDAMLDENLAHMHCDEPLTVLTAPSPMTRERFGSVPRHYFRALNDESVLPAAQERMIAAVDDAMGNRTMVHTLPSSHSPHVTHPAELAEQLSALARTL
ncbi:alpha/beta fold hydrolase [Paraburkholderia solisilvae]|nr:alpha/beta fold hydrolase [Paraburkholderia solisilvae]